MIRRRDRRRAPAVDLLPRCLIAGSMLLTVGCAGGPRPIASSSEAPGDARGYRALFRAESQSPSGKVRFKLAVALLPPARFRLEFFGPAGGPRLIIASDGTDLTALLPGDRTYDREDPGPAAMDRLVGLPLDGGQFVSLLTGRPMCQPEVTEHQVMTKAAATFGRTLSWYEATCPPGEVRYQARSEDRGGVLRQATVREGISGAIILEVEYGDHEEGLGPRWPRRIQLKLAREHATVLLAALEGPGADEVPDAIFAPPIPDGFEKRPLSLSLPAPGLLGSTADGGR
jgi:hypothetical protein